MSSNTKISIVTVHGGSGYDLQKTLNSVDNQIVHVDMHIVVAKNLRNFNCDKYKKNYRKFIIGKDKSLWNAMNIGQQHCKNFNILFLNSGDTFYNRFAVYNLKKFINCNNKSYTFKTLLVLKEIFFSPKLKYFNSKSYRPHPSFVRSSINRVYLNKFNETNLINADGEWMDKEMQVYQNIKINKYLTTHYLGGRSSKPTLQSVKSLITYSYLSGYKEFIKLLLSKMTNYKAYYKLIYLFKYDISIRK